MDDPKFQAIKAKMKGLSIRKALEQGFITKEESQVYYKALTSKFGLKMTPDDIKSFK
jgi:hypothetical protein